MSRVNFLLVDDKEENLLAIEGLLRRPELSLLKARSGPEALELALVHEIALAILDVQMPGMDGFELAELLRGASRTRHIPIIFLTAGGMDERRKFRGYEAGAVDFLFKPIEPAVLQGKADVFYDLYCQRQEVVRQRDQLRAAAEENSRLFDEIVQLNDSLEIRVKERTTQLLEANEQLKGFTYSIAHDFRQHIRSINLNAQIVLNDFGAELGPFRSNIERIQVVAKLMNQMSDDLLTYARARTIAMRPVSLDISLLAQELGEVLRSDYPQTNLVVAPGLQICGDSTMFRIVLENLLDNAFKYSQHSPEPLVEVGYEPGGFFVRDNGIGIDLTFEEKIFMPFERLLPPDQYPGAGMGLANVKRILERHGGNIGVTSAPGEGSTFHVTLSEADDPTSTSGAAVS